MNLSEAFRVMNRVDAMYPELEAIALQGEQVFQEYIATLPEGGQIAEACRIFAQAEDDHSLATVKEKCIEIAKLNPQGGHLEDLFDAAVEVVQPDDETGRWKTMQTI